MSWPEQCSACLSWEIQVLQLWAEKSHLKAESELTKYYFGKIVQDLKNRNEELRREILRLREPTNPLVSPSESERSSSTELPNREDSEAAASLLLLSKQRHGLQCDKETTKEESEDATSRLVGSSEPMVFDFSHVANDDPAQIYQPGTRAGDETSPTTSQATSTTSTA